MLAPLLSRGLQNGRFCPIIRPMRADGLIGRLRRLARSRGWTYVEREGRGSHVVVKIDGRQTSVPMHRGDLPIGTYRGILRALGQTPDDMED